MLYASCNDRQTHNFHNVHRHFHTCRCDTQEMSRTHTIYLMEILRKVPFLLYIQPACLHHTLSSNSSFPLTWISNSSTVYGHLCTGDNNWLLYLIENWHMDFNICVNQLSIIFLFFSSIHNNITVFSLPLSPFLFLQWWHGSYRHHAASMPSRRGWRQRESWISSSVQMHGYIDKLWLTW